MPTTAPPEIFKAYDVRGLYGDEIDGDVAEQVGRAFVRVLAGMHGKDAAELRVGLGRDMRLQAPEMAGRYRDGMVSEGAHVLDAGMVGTEMLYFLVGSRELDGGLMCTASHNPKAYTGAKLVRRGALALSGDAGIGEIRDLIASGEFGDPAEQRGAAVFRRQQLQRLEHQIERLLDRELVLDPIALLAHVAREQTRERAEEAGVGLAGQVTFRVGSATALPFDAESFDAAMLIHVAMNIIDKERLCAEVVRVLAGAGVLQKEIESNGVLMARIDGEHVVLGERGNAQRVMHQHLVVALVEDLRPRLGLLLGQDAVLAEQLDRRLLVPREVAPGRHRPRRRPFPASRSRCRPA